MCLFNSKFPLCTLQFLCATHLKERVSTAFTAPLGVESKNLCDNVQVALGLMLAKLRRFDSHAADTHVRIYFNPTTRQRAATDYL